MKHIFNKIIIPILFFTSGSIFLTLYISDLDIKFSLPEINLPEFERVTKADVPQIERKVREKKIRIKSKDIKSGDYVLKTYKNQQTLVTSFASFELPTSDSTTEKDSSIQYNVTKIKEGFSFDYGETKLEFTKDSITIDSSKEFNLPVRFEQREPNNISSAFVFKTKKKITVLTPINQIELSEDNIKFQKDSYIKISSNNNIESALSNFYKDLNEPINVDIYENSKNIFFEKAYSGLINSRYQSWDGKSFDNTIFSALYSFYEANKSTHKDFPLAKVIVSAKQNKNKFNLTSSMFAGNTFRTEEKYYFELRDLSYRYKTKMSQNDFSIFTDSKRLYESTYITTQLNNRNLSTSINSISDFSKFSYPELNGILEVSNKIIDSDGSYKSILSKQINKLTSYILMNIEKNDSCYTINNGDILETIKFAQNLLKYSQFTNDSELSFIAKAISIKLFELSDKIAILPVNLYKDNGQIIYPEQLYRYLFEENLPQYFKYEVDNEYYTIFGIKDYFKMSKSGKNLTINVSCDVDTTNNYILYQIPKFKNYQMYDRNWARDWDFQNYYAGSYYSSKTKKMFIKIKQKKATETMRILY